MARWFAALLLDVVYLCLLAVLSPYLAWQALRKGKYREGFAAKLLGRVPRRRGHRFCVWLHAVSVGEVNVLAPLLEQLGRLRPDWELVVSTTTMTGFALARKKYARQSVFYCPLDFSWATRAAMRRVRPDLLVLAELELWPNLIAAARRHGARVAVFNGRLSESSFRGYRRLQGLLRPTLERLDAVAAQNQAYAERFIALGCDPRRVHVTGSVKFDGARTDRRNPATARLRRLAGFADDDPVLLAGSTQEPEEALALETFRALQPDHPRLRLVLVPRHPDRFAAVGRMLEASGVPWQRRTELAEVVDGADAAAEPAPSPAAARVLLVDTVGELGAWWGTADVAFVGGSMGSRGGQNMIEPAAYGAAVCFGPNTRNFRDVVEALLRRDAACVVADGEELTAFARRCLEDPAFAHAVGRRAQELVLAQQGATQRTTELLLGLAGEKALTRAA